jgi:hypothetical protein
VVAERKGRPLDFFVAQIPVGRFGRASVDLLGVADICELRLVAVFDFESFESEHL